ncbi:RICIN domain-containing protein [Streptomyces sp. NPDC050523]|uniref:RICIN domain-containing protein n=1 Tax=Streptomyces sp. NPDC050523 TaxID=3365622 RepID=UPI00378D1E5F
MSLNKKVETPDTEGPLLPGEPEDPGPAQPSGAAQEPPDQFDVRISDDGSATIDGTPVPRMGEEPVDGAILDTLHGYARHRERTVTAVITDSSAGYAVHVEVAPDGSSTLLERHALPDGGEDTEPPAAAPDPIPVPAISHDEPLADEFAPDEFAADSAPLGHSPRTLSPSALTQGLPRIALRRSSSQSDDEYESSKLFSKPAIGVAVAAVIAVLVVVPLALVGSSGGEAAGTGAAKTPQPTPSSAPASPSSEPSASKSSSKPSTSPSSKSPEPSTSGVPGAGIPEGTTLVKNKKTTMCLTFAGKGKRMGNGTKSYGQVAHDTCEKSKSDDQDWTLKRGQEGKGTGGADLYVIRNVSNGLCLDVQDFGSVPPMSPVGAYSCDDTDRDNQLWWFDKQSNGAYWIRNQKSDDLCLDVAGDSKEGAPLAVYGCSELDGDRQWTFVKP